MKLKSWVFAGFCLLVHGTAFGQNWAWANALGTANSNTKVEILKKYNGPELLVAGSFAAATLTLGNETLSNAGQDDAFVAIANENGGYEWATRIGGAGRDFTTAVAADNDGNIYVAGDFYSLTLDIGASTLFNAGESDGFVIKYNADRSIAWVRAIGTAEVEHITGLAVDGSGNVYVSGHTLDKFTLSAIHTFFTKIAPDNNLLWTRYGTISGGFLETTTLAIDEDENLYLAGTFYGSVTFGGNNTLAADTSYAGFIAKYNASGVYLQGIASGQLHKITELAVDGDYLYACGELVKYQFGWGWPLSSSAIHLVKYNPDLTPVWHKSAGGQTLGLSLDLAKSVSTDDSGNIYVAGSFFSDSLWFAGQPLLNVFGINYFYPQVFVFKYSPAGEELGGKSAGGGYWDEATAVLATSDNRLYLGGVFESDEITFGNHTLTNTGMVDSIYVHQRPGRYGRKTIGFLGRFDGQLTNIRPEAPEFFAPVFPNPANDCFFIPLKTQSGKLATLRVLGADGRLVKSGRYEAIGQHIRVEAGDLAPGIYFISIQIDEYVSVQKLVKL